MTSSHYDVTATTIAPPAVVWRLLLDARTWPQWTPIDELVVERSTNLGPDNGSTQVGSIRAFRVGEGVTGERVTELVEEQRFSYEDAFIDAMRDYQASIELTPTPTGTSIHWHGTYTPAPGLESVLPDYLRDFMRQMADGLATHAAELTEPTDT